MGIILKKKREKHYKTLSKFLFLKKKTPYNPKVIRGFPYLNKAYPEIHTLYTLHLSVLSNVAPK